LNHNNLELFDDLTVAINEAVKELEIYNKDRLDSGLYADDLNSECLQ
jgi:hypothetical protein